MALKTKENHIFLWILITLLSIGISAGMTIASNTASDSKDRGGLGSGVLHVYTDSARTNEAQLSPSGTYLVLYDTHYYFRITGIEEYRVGQSIHVLAIYQDADHDIWGGTIGTGGTVDFDWTIPMLPYGTDIKYKYASNPSWRWAKRTTRGIGLTLVIPQVPLGVLGAASALIAACSIKALTSKKRLLPK